MNHPRLERKVYQDLLTHYTTCDMRKMAKNARLLGYQEMTKTELAKHLAPVNIELSRNHQHAAMPQSYSRYWNSPDTIESLVKKFQLEKVLAIGDVNAIVDCLRRINKIFGDFSLAELQELTVDRRFSAMLANNQLADARKYLWSVFCNAMLRSAPLAAPAVRRAPDLPTPVRTSAKIIIPCSSFQSKSGCENERTGTGSRRCRWERNGGPCEDMPADVAKRATLMQTPDEMPVLPSRAKQFRPPSTSSVPLVPPAPKAPAPKVMPTPPPAPAPKAPVPKVMPTPPAPDVPLPPPAAPKTVPKAMPTPPAPPTPKDAPLAPTATPTATPKTVPMVVPTPTMPAVVPVLPSEMAREFDKVRDAGIDELEIKRDSKKVGCRRVYISDRLLTLYMKNGRMEKYNGLPAGKKLHVGMENDSVTFNADTVTVLFNAKGCITTIDGLPDDWLVEVVQE